MKVIDLIHLMLRAGQRAEVHRCKGRPKAIRADGATAAARSAKGHPWSAGQSHCACCPPPAPTGDASWQHSTWSIVVAFIF